MTPIEVFAISFAGSFSATLVALVVTYWIYKKQIEQMKKLKLSLQKSIRRLKKGAKK